MKFKILSLFYLVFLTGCNLSIGIHDACDKITGVDKENMSAVVDEEKKPTTDTVPEVMPEPGTQEAVE